MAVKGRAKIKYAVQCAKHGVESKVANCKVVYVSKPINRAKAMTGGCPLCRQDKLTA